MNWLRGALEVVGEVAFGVRESGPTLARHATRSVAVARHPSQTTAPRAVLDDASFARLCSEIERLRVQVASLAPSPSNASIPLPIAAAPPSAPPPPPPPLPGVLRTPARQQRSLSPLGTPSPSRKARRQSVKKGMAPDLKDILSSAKKLRRVSGAWERSPGGTPIRESTRPRRQVHDRNSPQALIARALKNKFKAPRGVDSSRLAELARGEQAPGLAVSDEQPAVPRRKPIISPIVAAALAGKLQAPRSPRASRPAPAAPLSSTDDYGFDYDRALEDGLSCGYSDTSGDEGAHTPRSFRDDGSQSKSPSFPRTAQPPPPPPPPAPEEEEPPLPPLPPVPPAAVAASPRVPACVPDIPPPPLPASPRQTVDIAPPPVEPPAPVDIPPPPLPAAVKTPRGPLPAPPPASAKPGARVASSTAQRPLPQVQPHRPKEEENSAAAAPPSSAAVAAAVIRGKPGGIAAALAGLQAKGMAITAEESAEREKQARAALLTSKAPSQFVSRAQRWTHGTASLASKREDGQRAGSSSPTHGPAVAQQRIRSPGALTAASKAPSLPELAVDKDQSALKKSESTTSLTPPAHAAVCAARARPQPFLAVPAASRSASPCGSSDRSSTSRKTGSLRTSPHSEASGGMVESADGLSSPNSVSSACGAQQELQSVPETVLAPAPALPQLKLDPTLTLKSRTISQLKLDPSLTAHAGSALSAPPTAPASSSAAVSSVSSTSSATSSATAVRQTPAVQAATPAAFQPHMPLTPVDPSRVSLNPGVSVPPGYVLCQQGGIVYAVPKTMIQPQVQQPVMISTAGLTPEQLQLVRSGTITQEQYQQILAQQQQQLRASYAMGVPAVQYQQMMQVPPQMLHQQGVMAHQSRPTSLQPQAGMQPQYGVAQVTPQQMQMYQQQMQQYQLQLQAQQWQQMQGVAMRPQQVTTQQVPQQQAKVVSQYPQQTAHK
eukprot:m51a1_g796 hypothetical protein (948) ;mRNA; r:643329-647069